MKYRSLSMLALSAASAMASADFQDSIHAEFQMGAMLPRQASNAAAGASTLQVFAGGLGGIKAAAVTNTGNTDRPFSVNGDTFTDFQSAANRACDDQHNQCADMANSKQGNFEVSDCDKQDSECKLAANSATQTTFPGGGSSTTGTGTVGTPILVSQNAQFDFFCDP